MTTERHDATTETTAPTEAERARRAAAKREERQGWYVLTAIFVGGGILVAVASVAT